MPLAVTFVRRSSKAKTKNSETKWLFQICLTTIASDCCAFHTFELARTGDKTSPSSYIGFAFASWAPYPSEVRIWPNQLSNICRRSYIRKTTYWFNMFTVFTSAGLQEQTLYMSFPVGVTWMTSLTSWPTFGGSAAVILPACRKPGFDGSNKTSYIILFLVTPPQLSFSFSTTSEAKKLLFFFSSSSFSFFPFVFFFTRTQKVTLLDQFFLLWISVFPLTRKPQPGPPANNLRRRASQPARSGGTPVRRHHLTNSVQKINININLRKIHDHHVTSCNTLYNPKSTNTCFSHRQNQDHHRSSL